MNELNRSLSSFRNLNIINDLNRAIRELEVSVDDLQALIREITELECETKSNTQENNIENEQKEIVDEQCLNIQEKNLNLQQLFTNEYSSLETLSCIDTNSSSKIKYNYSDSNFKRYTSLVEDDTTEIKS
jgi:hypothetical protein